MSAKTARGRTRRGQGDRTSFPSGGTVDFEGSKGTLVEDAMPPPWAALGLERKHLADGRSVVHGRLTGRRIG
jgi:hypothetical protein